MGSEIVGTVISLVFAGLAAFVGPAVKRLFKAFGLSMKGQLDDQLENYILSGLEFAEKKTKQAGKDWTNNIEIENELVSQAVSYVNKHAPELLDELGVTEQSVRERIERYLAK